MGLASGVTVWKNWVSQGFIRIALENEHCSGWRRLRGLVLDDLRGQAVINQHFSYSTHGSPNVCSSNPNTGLRYSIPGWANRQGIAIYIRAIGDASHGMPFVIKEGCTRSNTKNVNRLVSISSTVLLLRQSGFWVGPFLSVSRTQEFEYHDHDRIGQCYLAQNLPQH